MKIIFDSEEQKSLFFQCAGMCPSALGFEDDDAQRCWEKEICTECWERSGIEIEVKYDEID